MLRSSRKETIYFPTPPGTVKEGIFNLDNPFSALSFDNYTMNYVSTENGKYCFENPCMVKPPAFVNLTVTETEAPGNITKKAVVETGAIVFVPNSIKKGDKIQIDTVNLNY